VPARGQGHQEADQGTQGAAGRHRCRRRGQRGPRQGEVRQAARRPHRHAVEGLRQGAPEARCAREERSGAAEEVRRARTLLVCTCVGIGAALPASTTVAAASAPTKGTKLHEGDRYVSLGSSLASGFGISNQSTACGRSDRSYAFIVAKKYGLDLVDVSCGG